MIGRKLEYLLALAKERHFARAASVCHVSQPTLSAGIQQLETELGVQIVKRGQRFQGFTEAGDIVLEWARNMAGEYDRLHRKLRDRSGSFSGTLRLGVLGHTIPLLKILTLPFHRRYPSVNLKVVIQSAFDIQQGLQDSSLDIAITYLDKKSRRYSRAHPLYTEEYELLVRKGSRFSGQKSVGWEAVKQLPLCLLFPEVPIFGAEESEILNEAVSQTPHIITNAIWMVMDHVRTGEWASVLPRPVRIMISGDDELEAIPLPKTGTPPSIGIAMPLREPASPLAEAFFEIATSSATLERITDLLSPAAGSPQLIRKAQAGRKK